MYILRIEHTAPDFAAWKKTFDSDPLGRKKSGVKRFRISRSIDDTNNVTVDLEFDSIAQAESLLEGLRGLWSRIAGSIITSPKAQIIELVEAVEL